MCWIADALRAVREAGLVGKALKLAQYQIFEVAKNGSASSLMAKVEDEFNMTAEQERILALVREFTDIEGLVKIKSMPDLGRWLRANGLPDMARRVSRASKGTNIQAHPDVTLDAELRRALVSRSLCDVTDSS